MLGFAFAIVIPILITVILLIIIKRLLKCSLRVSMLFTAVAIILLCCAGVAVEIIFKKDVGIFLLCIPFEGIAVVLMGSFFFAAIFMPAED